MNKQKVVWWVSVCLLLVLTWWLSYSGITLEIWKVDSTKLTSVIALLGAFWFIVKNGWVVTECAFDQDFTSSWFISELLMGIGMLGTVLGLIVMLATNDITAFTTNPTLAIGGMWQAMGLALYTNAVGLGASLLLKAQTFVLESLQENQFS